jgi:probable O-glycosylation ligase (exosortase A-associated)
MRDIALIGFLLALLGLGFRRPFFFVLAYAYVDIVSPQRLSYFLLNSVPVSLICFALAVLAWLVFDDKRGSRFAPRQGLLLLLLLYCWATTINADIPIAAAEKWDWVWKALVFAIFLPLTLRTKLRIEALALFMTLCAASIIITGGIKTLLSGGGYGVLALPADTNSGLYESSTISTVAIALIPLIVHLAKRGTIFPPDWRTTLFAYALIFACLLIPVGTEARTGVVCIAVLGLLALRHIKRRLLYVSIIGALGLAALPLLPGTFTERVGTMKEVRADESASTRLAVWKWTWDYVQDHPFGGGFDAYRQNKLRYETVDTTEGTSTVARSASLVEDKGRAYHSAYFEMLGEQGWPGLILWLIIHVGGVVRMEVLQRRYRGRTAEEGGWIGDLAAALQTGHIIYLVGSLFVGIAFQPFVYMLVGMQIGLDSYARRTARPATARPFIKQAGAAS